MRIQRLAGKERGHINPILIQRMTGAIKGITADGCEIHFAALLKPWLKPFFVAGDSPTHIIPGLLKGAKWSSPPKRRAWPKNGAGRFHLKSQLTGPGPERGAPQRPNAQSEDLLYFFALRLRLVLEAAGLGWLSLRGSEDQAPTPNTRVVAFLIFFFRVSPRPVTTCKRREEVFPGENLASHKYPETRGYLE